MAIQRVYIARPEFNEAGVDCRPSILPLTALLSARLALLLPPAVSQNDELLQASPEARLQILDRAFLRFDDIVSRSQALKIETVAGVYLVAANGAWARTLRLMVHRLDLRSHWSCLATLLLLPSVYPCPSSFSDRPQSPRCPSPTTSRS